MRKRIADLPLDFESILGLLLAGFQGLGKFNEYFTDYFPGFSRIYPTVYFQRLDYLSRLSSSRYLMLLTEFLTDPGRAGEHALDGPDCALVVTFLLDCFIPPCSERNFLR